MIEIGAAGPLAGFIVTLPVLMYGLAISKITSLPATIAQAQGLSLEGNSILYILLKYIFFGRLLPAPADAVSITNITYWLRYYLTGQPLPLGGLDIHLSSIAWAGWAGLLVTALNLIPVGQLDGGHLFYGLFGNRGRFVYPIIVIVLIGLGFFWNGWWLWAVLLFFFGRSHTEPLDQVTALDSPHKIIAVLCLILFLLIFTPIPLIVVGG